MTVNILGTPYEIVIKKYADDEIFESNSFCGYCDPYKKEIVLCDMNTYPGWQNDEEITKVNCHKSNLRHEIIHAFFYESGLWSNTNQEVGPWAKNEELIDWLSIQGVKIYKAWKEADAI